MSEHMPTTPNHAPAASHEQTPKPEAHGERAHVEAAEHHAKHEKRSEHLEHAKRVEAAHAAVAEAAAKASEQVMPAAPVVDQVRYQLIDNVAKRLRMKRSLDTVQTKLNPTERRFSKVVHQPLVRAVSEKSAQTLARPSGLLGSGITAFVGGVVYQWLTRHYALPYNFGLALLFFVGGFFIGLLGESLIRGLRKVSR